MAVSEICGTHPRGGKAMVAAASGRVGGAAQQFQDPLSAHGALASWRRGSLLLLLVGLHNQGPAETAHSLIPSAPDAGHLVQLDPRATGKSQH